MRSLPVAAASAVALLAVSAHAQAVSRQAHASPYRQTLVPAAPGRTTMPDPLRTGNISDILGRSVYGRDNKKIGAVSIVLIDPRTHQIARLIVRSGGVLGIGARQVALPANDFTWNGKAKRFRIAQTARQVSHMTPWRGPNATPPTGSGQSARAPLPASRAGQ